VAVLLEKRGGLRRDLKARRAGLPRGDPCALNHAAIGGRVSRRATRAAGGGRLGGLGRVAARRRAVLRLAVLARALAGEALLLVQDDGTRALGKREELLAARALARVRRATGVAVRLMALRFEVREVAGLDLDGLVAREADAVDGRLVGLALLEVREAPRRQVKTVLVVRGLLRARELDALRAVLHDAGRVVHDLRGLLPDLRVLEAPGERLEVVAETLASGCDLLKAGKNQFRAGRNRALAHDRSVVLAALHTARRTERDVVLRDAHRASIGCALGQDRPASTARGDRRQGSRLEVDGSNSLCCVGDDRVDGSGGGGGHIVSDGLVTPHTRRIGKNLGHLSRCELESERLRG